MKLSPRYTLILVAVGVLLVVVVAAAVLVVPQVGKMSDVEARMASVDDEVTQAENLLQARQVAKEDAAFTDAALLELAAAVPENPDLPSLIIELQDIAYDTNVQLRAIEPAEVTQASGYVAVPLTVQVWGSWADSVDFVQQLRKMTRQVRVVETQTSLLDEGDLPDAVEALSSYSVESQILLETYVIPSSADTGAGAAIPAPAE